MRSRRRIVTRRYCYSRSCLDPGDRGGRRSSGQPTGTISGRVVDPEGLAVPGALVTVASSALQGVRTATTSTNGDYIIPFLPAGDYEVTFELQGFQTV